MGEINTPLSFQNRASNPTQILMKVTHLEEAFSKNIVLYQIKQSLTF